MRYATRNLTLIAYRITDNNTIEQVGSVLVPGTSTDRLAAVMDDVLIVKPSSLSRTSQLLFYDWNLKSLNLSLKSNSKRIYTTKIVDF
jgi:hypothetical protein